MIDNFSILLAHGLLLLTAWRVLSRVDLDHDDAAAEPTATKSWSESDRVA